jgi:hypothetical protein
MARGAEHALKRLFSSLEGPRKSISRAGNKSLFLAEKFSYFPFGKFRGIVEHKAANISRSVKQ